MSLITTSFYLLPPKDFVEITSRYNLLGVLIFFLSAQKIQHEAIALNIEVAVRGFDGETFIDTQTINDLEVLEDGIEQKVEAVYFIIKTNIEKHDELIESAFFTLRASQSHLISFVTARVGWVGSR